ncbi:MAG: Nuclease SbcCD subunit D [Anaerolineales bacterium]|nr:Nuclease SbcCD subunit D [Anaerolineales bacterium]WKZ51358.1 MAG: exonuclease SbcCD subunit D [Anaerolineales bacterium]GIK10256.1 MAG: nuclease SbcCD subunit D [Chloroflexota bacterium]
MKLLHFADAHIDMANYGRHDPATGLPLRVLDFLKSLDAIVDAAIDGKVDLVIFAGDAYKDRSPAPTFQREWGRRIVRLSQARIPTLLLVGNHDLSPSIGRAHAIQEFDTLQVPYVKVLDKPQFLAPKDLWDLPAQVIAMPWVSRSGLMANLEMSAENPEEVYSNMEARISDLVAGWIESADPSLPLILTAHASVEGAAFGMERTVMLGADLVLPASLTKDKRLDYVALGHIHKPQNLNEGAHPPVIYPGSIERVDFGEAADDKFFVVAEVEKGETRVEWKKLAGTRPFIDCRAALQSGMNVTETLKAALPSERKMDGAIVRLVVDYPREMDAMIDEAALRKYAGKAFEFHFVKRPQVETRVRLPEDRSISSLSPLELLEIYWRAAKVDDADALQTLAREILEGEEEQG